MNYLKRMSMLYRSVSEKYKNGSLGEKERDEKFDEIKGLLDTVLGIRSDIIEDSIDNLLKGENTQKKPEDRQNKIRESIVRLNEICVDNKVDPVFPEVGSDTGPRETAEAIERYLKQLHKSDRLLRDALDEFLKTGDYDKYTIISDYINDHIDQMIDSKEERQSPDKEGRYEDEADSGVRSVNRIIQKYIDEMILENMHN
ncbi:MAG: hypothetical protein J5829_04695 [Lachnospiraceae bacterium]|nr:hypothetical protein [Lachnospiraceae bacterium]